MKKETKTDIIVVLILLALFLICAEIIESEKSKVEYTGTSCIKCGSSEVGDFGENTDADGNVVTKAHCFNCGYTYFYSE
jgi:predicted nucleic-acid-binding Zn-ribbon protein